MADLSLETSAEATQTFSSQQHRLQLLMSLWRLAALVLLIVVFSLLSPYFLTQSNWLNTSLYTTTTLILALGETFVIISAGIDLSVGATLGVASSVAAVYLADAGSGWWPVVVACLLGVASGVGIGLVNGFIIAVLEISPFITTLGMLGVGTGITYLITNGADVRIPVTINGLGNGVWFGWIPIPVAIAAALSLIAYFVLRFTRFGVYTYALGSDAETARRSGIHVNRHLIALYMLSGLFAGIAGVLTVAQFLVGSPTAGQDAELGAISAVVIGGASLFGGQGDIGGTVIGSIIVSSIVTGLVLVGVEPYWQTVTIGTIIVFAVFVQQLGDRNFRFLSRRRRSLGRARRLIS
jgi:ribose transport system permease protein